MAITTVSGAIAGQRIPQFFAKVGPATPSALVPSSTWVFAGQPTAGTNQSGLTGAVLSSSSTLVAGQIPHYNPSSGNSYLARLQAQCSVAGTLLLCDRLWSDTISGSTGSQSIASPTWPARDNSGSTNGDGVLIAMEFMTAGSAGIPSITLSYTNSANSSSKTGTLIGIDGTSASNPIGTFLRIGLATGDLGVRSIQTATIGSAITVTTLQLVAYRVIASLEVPQAGTTAVIDALTSGFPRIYNGAVPFLVFIPNSAFSGGFTLSGSYIESQG